MKSGCLPFPPPLKSWADAESKASSQTGSSPANSARRTHLANRFFSMSSPGKGVWKLPAVLAYEKPNLLFAKFIFKGRKDVKLGKPVWRPRSALAIGQPETTLSKFRIHSLVAA